MVEDAEQRGILKEGSTLIEASGGNTGSALAMIASLKGYKAAITLGASIAVEKGDIIRRYGGEVIVCPAVPFTDERHYFHAASKLASETPNSLFCNQFENEANFRCHFEGTGPEIWKQSGQDLDAFICSSGTGGTIGGVSTYLKQVNPKCLVYLVDPQGSGNFDYVKSEGETSKEQGEIHGHLVNMYTQKAPGGTVIQEGIGIDRATSNFVKAKIDGAMVVTDQEAVEMAYYLTKYEGLCLGPSAAINVVGAVKLAKHLGPGHTIATILCDGGERYQSKLYSPEYLKSKGLEPRIDNKKRGNINFVEGIDLQKNHLFF